MKRMRQLTSIPLTRPMKAEATLSTMVGWRRFKSICSNQNRRLMKMVRRRKIITNAQILCANPGEFAIGSWRIIQGKD